VCNEWILNRAIFNYGLSEACFRQKISGIPDLSHKSKFTYSFSMVLQIKLNLHFLNSSLNLIALIRNITDCFSINSEVILRKNIGSCELYSFFAKFQYWCRRK
jgi:hypothetical protein